MKKLVIPFCFATFLAFGACNGNGADNANSDSTKTGQNGSASSTTSDSNANNNAATAATNTPDTSMGGDKNFVMDAASGGMMEVELGKMASTAAASAKVKEFGRMMVTDHTKANNELKAVAGKKNITVPAAPADKEQGHINDMKSKKGADFDKDYVDMMVNDHKEDISKFEDESKNGKDADVKAFATKTLPVLRKHLASIQAIQNGMKK